MKTSLARRRGGTWAAAGFVLAVYVLLLHTMPADVFWHPDEGGKFIEALTVHWNHGLAYRLPYPGRRVDARLAFYPGHCDKDGVLYPSPRAGGAIGFHWPIWFPLVSRVFFEVFGMAGIYILPLASGWLAAILAGRWAAVYDAALTPITTLVVGCATPLMLYSVTFFEHTLATLLFGLALSTLVAARAKGIAAAWRMGPPLLVAIILRVEMLAFAAALLLTWAVSAWLARGWSLAEHPTELPRHCSRQGVLLSATALAGLVAAGILLLAYSLVPRHWNLVRALPSLLDQNLSKLPYIWKNLVHIFIGFPGVPAAATIWDATLLFAMAAAAVAAFVASRRLEAALILPSLTILLGWSVRMVLFTRPYAHRQGILAVAPYLIVGLYLLPHAWRRRDIRLFRLAAGSACCALMAFLLLFTSRVSQHGVYAIGLDGPVRYVLPLYPLGAVASVMAVRVYLRSARARAMKVGFTVLVVAMVFVSLQYELKAVRAVHADKHALTVWQAALRGSDPVVTDTWWLPAVLAPFFATHELYAICNPAEMPRWLAAAAGQGVTSGVFASADAVDVRRLGIMAGDAGPRTRDGGRFIPLPFHGIAQQDRPVNGLHLYPFQVTAGHWHAVPAP